MNMYGLPMIYNIRITPAGLEAVMRIFNENDVRDQQGRSVKVEAHINGENVRLDFQVDA